MGWEKWWSRNSRRVGGEGLFGLGGREVGGPTIPLFTMSRSTWEVWAAMVLSAASRDSLEDMSVGTAMRDPLVALEQVS